jgi:hypothetical protein
MSYSRSELIRFRELFSSKIKDKLKLRRKFKCDRIKATPPNAVGRETNKNEPFSTRLAWHLWIGGQQAVGVATKYS